MKKPNKATALRRNDGRKHNARKKKNKKEVARKKKDMTLSELNKAKKDRMTLYAINALRSEYSSEADFWKMIAEQARSSFNHAKLIMEYAYGKPQDNPGGHDNKKAPVINFYTNVNASSEDTIDVTHEEN